MPTALLTGAASGIGRATATALVDAGWDVYATDVDTDGLDELAARGCRTAHVDVTDRSSIDAVVDRITA